MSALGHVAFTMRSGAAVCDKLSRPYRTESGGRDDRSPNPSLDQVVKRYGGMVHPPCFGLVFEAACG